MLDELPLLRQLSHLQVWRVRFALENNDTATALEALECINKSIDRLDKDYAAVSHIFSYALLEKKKKAVELLLAKGNLDEPELKKQLDILPGKRKKLAAMERTALGGEITIALDLQEGVWEGKTWQPAIKKFRWFVPQYWYIIRHSCNIFIKSHQKNSFRGDPFSYRHILFNSKGYGKNIPRMYTESDTMYLLLETLLRLELEKRKQGFYPETAPKWLPVDPFTGRKFHYKKGDMPVFEKVYDPRMNLFRTTRRTVKAVAVWSEGANRKNDQGLRSYRESGSDDLCAMIRL